MKLVKDGISMTITSPSEIAYFKNLGYEEVSETAGRVFTQPESEEEPKKK